MAKGGVTTLVTASHDIDDEDLERIQGVARVPMGRGEIRVQCEHTREVCDLNEEGRESESSGEVARGRGRDEESGSGSERSDEVRTLVSEKKMGSREDLCACK
jgi:hypothetical protein